MKLVTVEFRVHQAEVGPDQTEEEAATEAVAAALAEAACNTATCTTLAARHLYDHIVRSVR